MGLLGKLFGGGPAEPEDVPTAHALRFDGPGPYPKELSDTCAVVFEDDGDTGYFYATDGSQQEIFDALLVYDRSDSGALQPGEEAFVVWNPARQRAGLYYHDSFQAIFDFSAKRGVCRSGFPTEVPTQFGWSKVGHGWDDSMADGIAP